MKYLFYFSPGDIITNINGCKIVSSKDVYNFLEEDSILDLTIVRNGNIINIEIDLDSWTEYYLNLPTLFCIRLYFYTL